MSHGGAYSAPCRAYQIGPFLEGNEPIRVARQAPLMPVLQFVIEAVIHSEARRGRREHPEEPGMSTRLRIGKRAYAIQTERRYHTQAPELRALRAAVCLGGAASLLSGATARAQRPSTAPHSARTLAVWTALARDQPLKTRLRPTRDRDLYILGLSAHWPLRSAGRVTLAYTADLLPAVVTTNMPTAYTAVPPPCPPQGPCIVPLASSQMVTRRTVYGAGAAPIGLELRLGVARPLALLVRGSAGVVYFARPVPDPAERQLNFTLDASAAAEVRVAPRLRLAVGYRFNHLSNAGRGQINPGMNSRMLELGVVLTR